MLTRAHGEQENIYVYCDIFKHKRSSKFFSITLIMTPYDGVDGGIMEEGVLIIIITFFFTNEKRRKIIELITQSWWLDNY